MSASYDKLKSKESKIIEIFEFRVSRLIHGASRSLTFPQKYANPWCIEVTERLHYNIFFEWFKPIEGHCVSFGRTTEIHRHRTYLRKVKDYTVTFHYLGTFKLHIGQIVLK